MTDDNDSFKDRVYWIVGQIPSGQVATYGQVASYAGSPRAARAVGNLMRQSIPNGVDVPWQRVINSQGGISSKGDVARAELQRKLLRSEGVALNRRSMCKLTDYRWQPTELFWETDD